MGKYRPKAERLKAAMQAPSVAQPTEEKIVAEAPSVKTAFLPSAPPVQAPSVVASVAVAADNTPSEQATQDRDKILTETDLTRKKLFTTISEGLEAECVLVDKEGKEVGRVPNHTARVKYANLAAEVLGEKISGNDSKNVNMINIYLPEQLRKARERFASVAGVNRIGEEDDESE